MSFDGEDLYVTDAGTRVFEEVDLAKKMVTTDEILRRALAVTIALPQECYLQLVLRFENNRLVQMPPLVVKN